MRAGRAAFGGEAFHRSGRRPRLSAPTGSRTASQSELGSGYCTPVEARDADARWFLARRLFLAGIALTFALAFGSLALQVRGLYGAQGIVPLAERMQLLAERLSAGERWRLPTLLWLGADEARLVLLSWLGLGLAAC